MLSQESGAMEHADVERLRERHPAWRDAGGLTRLPGKLFARPWTPFLETDDVPAPDGNASGT
jgi:hypothetical protein